MNKTNLPIKTRIAVWWIFFVGVVGTIATLIAPQILPHSSDEMEWGMLSALLALVSIAVGFLYIIPSILLRRKKRARWKAAVAILFIGSLSFTGLIIFYAACPEYYPWYVFTPAVIIYAVPLILVILDRKNYFEMVRQRELEKNVTK
jgi:hypothetical protein